MFLMVFQCCASRDQDGWFLANPAVKESLESMISEVHLNMRVLLRFVGWSLENGELTLVEGQLLGIELDSLSNPDQLIRQL